MGYDITLSWSWYFDFWISLCLGWNLVLCGLLIGSERDWERAYFLDWRIFGGRTFWFSEIVYQGFKNWDRLAYIAIGKFVFDSIRNGLVGILTFASASCFEPHFFQYWSFNPDQGGCRGQLAFYYISQNTVLRNWPLLTFLIMIAWLGRTSEIRYFLSCRSRYPESVSESSRRSQDRDGSNGSLVNGGSQYTSTPKTSMEKVHLGADPKDNTLQPLSYQSRQYSRQSTTHNSFSDNGKCIYIFRQLNKFDVQRRQILSLLQAHHCTGTNTISESTTSSTVDGKLCLLHTSKGFASIEG